MFEHWIFPSLSRPVAAHLASPSVLSGPQGVTALDTLCFLKEFKAGRFPTSLKSSNPVFPREIPSLFWWKIHVVFLFVAKTSMPARPVRPGFWPFSLRKWPRRYSIIHHKYNLRNYSIDIWYDIWYIKNYIWYMIYDIWYMIWYVCINYNDTTMYTCDILWLIMHISILSWWLCEWVWCYPKKDK